MTYQASLPYPAAAGGQWPAGQDYQNYYAAYGYANPYDASAYYQQPAAHYGAQMSALPESKAPPSADAASAAPQPSEEVKGATGAVSRAGEGASGGSTSSSPPPPPPPPPPESAEPSNAEQKTPNAPAAPASAPEASAAAAPAYDSAAYAEWYAQTYGPYYGYSGYPGYDQQAYAYWQQQQQQQQYAAAYGYPPQATAYQQQGQTVPQHEQQPADAKQNPSPYARPRHLPSSASAGGQSDSYNAQPPPSNLYTQNSGGKGHHDRFRNGPQGATGTNTVPLGPRAPSSTCGADGPQAAPQPQQTSSFVIRPQIPASKRPNASAQPAYIAIGSTPSTRPVPNAPATAAGTGKDPAVAAAVAAGAASAAAAAASAAKASAPAANASQWPASFTAWVTRCFSTARLRNVPDNRLSEKLMAYLEQVKGEGKLWTTDWDTMPPMLPDSPGESQGGAAAGTPGGSQVLSVGGAPKRSRWGAVPDSHTPGHGPDSDAFQHHHMSAGRQQHGSHRKRSHVFAESDDDDHSGGVDHGRGHKAHALNNRKRKKALELEHQRGGRRGNRGLGGAVGPSAEEQRRRARAGRFGNGRAAGAAPGSPDDDSSGMDMSDDDELASGRFGGIVVGTCQALEKSYFRLTSQPDPSTVRPEPVLERALERLVSLIARGEASYFYSLDQFKGMRQDCTVQHLRNSLAVRVYEAHARSSLEYGDIAEFNQCQARLGHLYAEGQPGCMAEFTAYRLLYETVHCVTAGRRAGGMSKALLDTMRTIPRDLAGTPEIRHALQVREAVMTYNYAAFFRLYATAPHMGRALMDAAAEHMRWTGLNAFVKACDLPIPVADVALLLGFSPRPAAKQGAGAAEQEERLLPGCMHARLEGEAAPAADADQGTADCAVWLRDHGAVISEKGSELLLDGKASRGKLFIPEVPAKVAHGDENLSLHDFLSAAQRSLAA